MWPHTCLFILVVFRSLAHSDSNAGLPDQTGFPSRGYSFRGTNRGNEDGSHEAERVCDSSRPSDVKSCHAYCNSLWGRVSLFGWPWSKGMCYKSDCICKFNHLELHEYADPCTHRSVWGSLRSNKKIARRAIEAKVVQMGPRQRFEVFKSAFKRRYSSKIEENRRFDIFQRNLVTIDRLNAQKKGSAVFGVNIFADYTQEEYMRTRGGKPPRSQSLTPRMFTPRGRKRSSSAPPPGRTNSKEPRFPERGGSVPPPYTIGRDPPEPPLKDWRVPAHLYPPTQPQFYISGVFDSDNCPNDIWSINHGVVIVGHYRDAWIIRDTVPEEWGLQGHYLMKKGICCVGLSSYTLIDPQIMTYNDDRSKRQKT